MNEQGQPEIVYMIPPPLTRHTLMLVSDQLRAALVVNAPNEFTILHTPEPNPEYAFAKIFPGENPFQGRLYAAVFAGCAVTWITDSTHEAVVAYLRGENYTDTEMPEAEWRELLVRVLFAALDPHFMNGFIHTPQPERYEAGE